MHWRALCLICPHIQAQNFAGFAFCGDLERAAANFAIRGERLGRDTGINDEFEALSTERTLDGLGYLHVALILLTI
jgi:hypothetical protein